MATAPAPPRTILHVDLDAFFASVEQRDDPSLRGKPVLVGGSVERGVVAAASYEARRFGIHSAMPMAEAMRRCPHAIVVRGDFARYREASEGFFAILRDVSPLVEAVSIDEAFVDVSGVRRLFGDGAAIARTIKTRVGAELGLVASAGVAPIKLAAKIASDLDKPDGLRVVEPDALLDFLHPLPVSKLWGVGDTTRERLEEIGVRTIGQLATWSESGLRSRLGDSLGRHLAALSRGDDPREVVCERAPVSLGHEETFDKDVHSRAELEAALGAHADEVASRLRRAGLRARTVVLKIKYSDFRLVSRRRTLADPTCSDEVIAGVARELSRELSLGRGVRLAGVSAAGLEPRDAPRQLSFDDGDRQRRERLGDTLDDIRHRFGNAAIARTRRND